MKTRLAVAALALLLLPAAASADTFTLSGSTQVSFTCYQSTPCSTSSNSVTFGTGPDTTTFTFAGALLNASVGSQASTLVLATVQTSITGAGFVSPVTLGGLSSPLGQMTITLTQDSPTAVTRTIAPFLFGGPGSYELLFGGNLGSGGTYLATPTGDPGYPHIVYSFNLDTPAVINLPVGSSTNVTAQVGAVPEPTTLLLLGTGLAGVATAARKRRRARS